MALDAYTRRILTAVFQLNAGKFVTLWIFPHLFWKIIFEIKACKKTQTLAWIHPSLYHRTLDGNSIVPLMTPINFLHMHNEINLQI